ncbi:CLUMA_CG005982, isoform A [Clunio marinus]|uniref:CLUMA_CG005982, isoform A n=1 Tax=Clunio marinus TaxID=568069 RepID=A0A1J1HYM2_9DIPT|nr:CLUMA_CG005982, isoform A [Clunio marinus]
MISILKRTSWQKSFKNLEGTSPRNSIPVWCKKRTQNICFRKGKKEQQHKDLDASPTEATHKRMFIAHSSLGIVIENGQRLKQTNAVHAKTTRLRWIQEKKNADSTLKCNFFKTGSVSSFEIFVWINM